MDVSLGQKVMIDLDENGTRVACEGVVIGIDPNGPGRYLVELSPDRSYADKRLVWRPQPEVRPCRDDLPTGPAEGT